MSFYVILNFNLKSDKNQIQLQNQIISFVIFAIKCPCRTYYEMWIRFKC